MKMLATFASVAVFLTGCQSESTSTPETSTTAEVTPAAFNVAGAPTVELHVPNMYCQYSCVAKVKEILAEQPGVKDVKVEFETKLATLAVNESTFDGQAAVAALVDYQFTDSKLRTAEHISPSGTGNKASVIVPVSTESNVSLKGSGG